MLSKMRNDFGIGTNSGVLVTKGYFKKRFMIFLLIFFDLFKIAFLKHEE